MCMYTSILGLAGNALGWAWQLCFCYRHSSKDENNLEICLALHIFSDIRKDYSYSVWLFQILVPSWPKDLKDSDLLFETLSASGYDQMFMCKVWENCQKRKMFKSIVFKNIERLRPLWLKVQKMSCLELIKLERITNSLILLLLVITLAEILHCSREGHCVVPCEDGRMCQFSTRSETSWAALVDHLRDGWWPSFGWRVTILGFRGRVTNLGRIGGHLLKVR